MAISIFLLEFAHIIGAAVLFGTGAGIAFFMLMAHRTGNPVLVAHTASIVVIADYLFTASAVVLQPLTGMMLMRSLGYELDAFWIEAALALYLVTGLFWLPVVFIQRRMRDLARRAVMEGADLPPLYHRLFRIWFVFGFPAFASVLAIVWLMIAKPDW